MSTKRVLFISEEITPYLPETPMSIKCRYLPQYIQERGKEVRSFVPKYGIINERRNQLHEVIRLSGMNIIINDNDHPLIIKVASIQSARMQIYFIDNDDYFQNRNIFHDNDGNEYTDNGERSVFFNRGTLETVKKLRWVPDFIHCHGWVSVLSALYLKKFYNDDPCYKNAKIIFSLYDDEFQLPLPKEMISWMQLPETDDHIRSFENDDLTFEALYKLCLPYCDGLILSAENTNQNIADYARSINLPVMPYASGDDYVEQYDNFYNAL